MSDDYLKFIDSLEAPSMKSVAKSMKVLGDYDYEDITKEKLEEIIISMRPKSPGAIVQICYILNLYAKFLEYKELSELIYNLDKTDVWQKAKDTAPKKFISNQQFMETYHDIGVYEDFNGFYQQTLFRCLYEGIYNDDMSVIKNLKASDINGNIVTLREDNGHVYDLEISTELANNLKELGMLDSWERRNGRGLCRIKISGLHSDSCFKVENRKGSAENAYRFSYYRILRKIAKEYVGYNLLPLQIYISGMMYRIKLELEKHNITLEQAFSVYYKDRLVHDIFEKELNRCNCDTVIGNFRMIVKGHIDVFDNC